MSTETRFDVVFSKVAEILGDARNVEFQVSVGEASPSERESIDELRRLALNVSADTATSFVTS